MTRVSLYQHELAVVERLTVELSRLSNEPSEIVGPQIFDRLTDILYARGNYRLYGNYTPIEPPTVTEAVNVSDADPHAFEELPI